MDASKSRATKPIYFGTRIVWYILGLIETLLLIRFLLKLFSANPLASFTDFIYSLSYPLVAPFINVFRITEVQGAVFEWATLLAMAVYWILAWLIIRLFFISKPVSTRDAAHRLDREDR